jgi:hypothetical protein
LDRHVSAPDNDADPIRRALAAVKNEILRVEGGWLAPLTRIEGYSSVMNVQW